jgi:putative Mn2+ efflux pump MntP
MTKHLKIGMICMVAAVLMMPVALFLKNPNVTAAIAVIIASMLLEVIGLIFVIVSLIKRRKNKHSAS